MEVSKYLHLVLITSDTACHLISLWKSNFFIFLRSKMISRWIKSTVVLGSWKNMCDCDIKAVRLMGIIVTCALRDWEKINMLTALTNDISSNVLLVKVP